MRSSSTSHRSRARDAHGRFQALVSGRNGLTRLAALVLAAHLAPGAWASAQLPDQPAGSTPARTLSLADALRLAEVTSEQITIAEAGVERAFGSVTLARSERKPQLSASGSYDRTLASEFSGIFDGAPSGPACDPLRADPTAALADRVTELERAYDCQPESNPFGDVSGSDLPFGQENAYRFNLAVSQTLYNGKRLGAQEAQAGLGRENASLTVSTTRAQVALDVAQAFYDAALADRLVAISEEALAQADRTYQQIRVQREAGRQSEFDVLRAQVARDTLRAPLIQSRSARELAHLRLKQLLDLPLDGQLDLLARLDDPVLAPEPLFAARLAEAERVDRQAERLAVAQVANQVRISEAAVDIARAQRLPTLGWSSAYGRVGYRGYPTLPRTNWTVSLSVSVPVLTGGRLDAGERTARADLSDARARLRQAQELAVLDAASARLDLASARASWESTAGTVEQAERAHAIAELRYREGLSTQLELSDARLLLQQAQVNRAQAARDVQVARVRLALLPDLPLTAQAGGAAGASAGAGSGGGPTASGASVGAGAPGAISSGGGAGPTATGSTGTLPPSGGSQR
jgi:outer membrane protein TolC